jgi:galactitol-specific phosphotransferase system IIB component
MSNVLDRLSPGFKATAALFTAAGLDLEAMLATGDVNALKAKLESSTGIAEAVQAATSELQAQLTAAQASVTTLTTQVGTYTAAFASTGITLNASADKPATADEIAAAIKARASVMASEQLGQHGLAAPLPVAPSADSLRAGSKQSVSYLEFQAMNPGAKAKFLREGGEIADGPSLSGR